MSGYLLATTLDMKSTNDLIKKSKRLAYLLRHSDIPDQNGWANISAVSSELNLQLQDIQQIVNSDDKGRFNLSDDNLRIRALYGHSIKIYLELKPTAPPFVLYHGTAEKYLQSIMKDGIIPRKRNYVHLSESKEIANQVGARHGNPIVLTVDAKSMFENGSKFYKAQKGVWLAERIPSEYIKIDNHE